MDGFMGINQRSIKMRRVFILVFCAIIAVVLLLTFVKIISNDSDKLTVLQQKILNEYVINNSDKLVLDCAFAENDSQMLMAVIFKNMTDNSESCIEFIPKNGMATGVADVAGGWDSWKYFSPDGLCFISTDTVKFSLIDTDKNDIYDIQLQAVFDGNDILIKVVSSEKRQNRQ
jgi:hypothetical protein